MKTLKASRKDLEEKGYIFLEDLDKYSKFDENDLYELLASKKARERTIAVKLLKEKWKINDSRFIWELVSLLKKERKIYTKSEIIETLMEWWEKVVLELVNHLGTIWANQYKKLPIKISARSTYPVPRDVIARILWKMDVSIFPLLVEYLEKDDFDIIKKRELIDSIWYIVFHNSCLQENDKLTRIVRALSKYDDKILFWKSLIMLSAFKNPLAKTILLEMTKDNDYKEKIFKDEVKSSLWLSFWIDLKK